MKELLNAPTGWMPGLTLTNSNGDVDTTSFGYDYAIRTTTWLRTKSIQQKFYEVPLTDYVTIEVGEGAWMENITQNLEFNASGNFESGIQNVSGSRAELAEVDVAISPVTYPIVTWAKGYKYAIDELKKALASNNWDIVKAKTDALKKNWDLGIQKTVFLGSTTITGVYGLLNQSGPTVDTATLTANISSLDADVFAGFVQVVLGLYFSNSNSTVLPDTFIMPMDDMLGLSAPVSSAFPMISKMELLTNAFKAATGNPKFRILGSAYAMKANNKGFTTAAGSQRYMLYRNDPEVVRQSIPANFTLTTPGTADNFQYKGVGYGQYTGVQCYRPREIYYFDQNVA
jgi:hypothetical protein